MNTTTKTKTATFATAQAGIDIVSKVSISMMAAFSGLISLWSVACFAGALLTSGPAALLTGWFAAVVGI